MQIFVIDVAGGDKVPRKGGPGVTFSDLLVINKTDLAPLVGADLDVMRRDAAKVRGERPFVLISLTDDPAAAPVLGWVQRATARAGAKRTMLSDVLIVARPDRVPRIECSGGVAARRTDADTVHLVSAAATPLGGDTIRVRVVVEAGARLRVRSAAATMAMPGTATMESHAPAGISRWRAISTSTRSPPSWPAHVAARHDDPADAGRRRPGCGCASGSRSADPMSAKASGRARCTPTSTARRCCGTASSSAPAR